MVNEWAAVSSTAMRQRSCLPPLTAAKGLLIDLTPELEQHTKKNFQSSNSTQICCFANLIISGPCQASTWVLREQGLKTRRIGMEQ